MLLNFIAFIIILVLIDLIWLVGAGKLHQKTIEMVQKTKVKIDYIASILFYILASTAFIVFVYPLSTTIELVITTIALSSILIPISMTKIQM